MKKLSFFAPVMAACLLVSGCGNDNRGEPVPAPTSPAPDIGAEPYTYRAVIERTSYGTAHITAQDYGSLGYGQGYAFAEDRFCLLMDQIVKVTSERSRFWGPDSTPGDGNNDFINLASDLGYKSLELQQKAPAAIASLSANAQQMLHGYVAGVNQYLADTGVNQLPGACAGAEWVRSISVDELVAYYFDVAMLAGTRNFVAAIGVSSKPSIKGADGKTASHKGQKTSRQSISVDYPIEIPKGVASNGVAIGKDLASDSQALLLSNTHLPWEGELKYHEVHLTIPGELDVAGVSLSGTFGVQIGFNQNVAWTHTTSPSNQFVMYQMALAEGDSTKYIYDGEVHDMTSKEVSVWVKSGSDYYTHSQTLYSTHYGPIVRADSMGLVWNAQTAFSLADVNGDSIAFLDMFLAKGKAQSVEQVAELYATVSGVPWNHSMVADMSGKVMYVDATMIPNIDSVTPIEAFGGATPLQALQAGIAANPQASAALKQGLLMADGSTSLFAMVQDTLATNVGTVQFGAAPQMIRTDFVANSNDNFWLTNPNAPFDAQAYSFLYGFSHTPRSYRTRMGLTQIAEHQSFDNDALAQLLFANRSLTADMFKDTLVSLCSVQPQVNNSQGVMTDVSEACSIIAAWDGRFNVDSVGAIIWRQTLSGLVNNHGFYDDSWYQVAFDPADAVNTPNGLSEAGQYVMLTGLADAVTFINQVVIADANGNDLFTLDAPLGQVQFAMKGDERIALHGGLPDTDGIFNKVESKRYGTGTLNTSLMPGSGADVALDPNTDLSTTGYHINYGASYVMTVALTEQGPQAKAMLTYSQSEHATSAHFADQTHLYSHKQWRPVPYSRADIEADSQYSVKVISK